MKFRILGPVSMSPHTPTAAKVRVLLAVLLLRGNEVVPTESLIDELWDVSPPRTVTTTLQVYISQLRTTLAAGAPESLPRDRDRDLQTVPPGYRLRIAPDDLDLPVFESFRRHGREAYDRGDFAEASHLLQEGLRLWTGVPLSGITHGPMLSSAAVRLEETRISTLEQRIAADLRVGRHRELTGELMALVGEHPFREILHAHLMVALYRCDRQSDALQAFKSARRGLVSELGVEPGAGLRRLHERILRSDPTLVWRGAAADERVPLPVIRMPHAAADFTGREELLTRAGKLLTAPVPAQGAAADTAVPSGMPPRVLAVGGRAGVGKTAFALELARRHAADFPDGRVLVQLRGPQGQALDSAQTMSRVLWQLEGVREAPVDRTVPADGSGDDRAGLARLLQRRLQGRTLLLVLDDAVSEAQLRPVLAAASDCFVVVTSRRTLAGLDGVRHLALEEMKPAEAQQLLLRVVGGRIADDPSAALEIAELCGCLPLALRVAAATLTAKPHWTAGSLARRLAEEGAGLDHFTLGDLDVRASLLVGYQEAGEAERSAFRRLSLGPASGFELWAAAALLNTSRAAAEQVVEQLVEAHLLSVRRGAQERPARYSYHRLLHALARELLAAEEPVGAQQAATERLCAAYLRLARHADALLAPGRRLPVPGPLGADASPAPTEPRPATGGAGPGEAPVVWFRDELEALVSVVRRAHADGLWELVWQLAAAMAGYFEAAAAWTHWAETYELALDAARRAEQPGARAAVLQSLGDLAWQQHRFRQARENYESAGALFHELRDPCGEARCLVGTADVELSEGDVERAAKLYAEAAELHRLGADRRGRADVSRGRALVALLQGRTEAALQAFAEFTEAAEQLGDRRWARFGYRSTERILEHMVDWFESGQRPAPSAVEARPGTWLVRDRSA